jgi:hypothetical protein
MKNFFTLLFFCCIFLNCTEESNEATRAVNSTTLLASKPEAKSMFDNSYKGIYKGIVIGNVSGTLYVNILNDGEFLAKFQTEDKVTYILEKVPVLREDKESSVPYLFKFRFANEKMSFDMKLDETGNNITVSNFNFFSNEKAQICLVKEKSTSLIKCYIGSYTGSDESGIVNFTSDASSKVIGLSKNSDSFEIDHLIGTIDVILPNDEISKTLDNNNPVTKYLLNANLHIGNISGYLSGNSFDGKWMYEETEFGDWHAMRML